MRNNDVLPVGATPFRAALWLLLICGLFGAGVFVGAAVIAPAQAENRAELDGRQMRPTADVTRAQARHACKQAETALKAVAERLAEPERVVHEWEGDDD